MSCFILLTVRLPVAQRKAGSSEKKPLTIRSERQICSTVLNAKESFQLQEGNHAVFHRHEA